MLVRAVEEAADVADVVQLDDGERRHLLLQAEAEVVVAAHLLLERGRADGRRRRVHELRAEEEVGHRPHRRRLIVEGRLIEAERHHVVVDAIGRALLLVEQPVAAADHGLLAERLPGEADARAELRPSVSVIDSGRPAWLLVWIWLPKSA